MKNILRYANCWEDAEVLLAGLQPKPQSKILSIASAGDNSFSLLTTEPLQIVCADINDIQLYLVALKQGCFRALDYEKMLAFLGFLPTQFRVSILQELKSAITYPQAFEFWKNNKKLIEKGVIYAGKFEKYFRFFREKLLPCIHNKKTVLELISPKSSEEQILFYDKKWNNWRWRLIFSIFFSRYVLGKYGRDKSFFNEVKVPVSEYIYQKTSSYLKNISTQRNFMLHFILMGNFGNLLPHYLEPENFEIIKQNIEKIVLFAGKVEEAIPHFGKFDCFNLSNIFEYMPESIFIETAQKLAQGAEKNAVFLYWNLMVKRVMSENLPEYFETNNIFNQNLSNQDKGFFYNQVIVEYKK